MEKLNKNQWKENFQHKFVLNRILIRNNWFSFVACLTASQAVSTDYQNYRLHRYSVGWKTSKIAWLLFFGFSLSGEDCLPPALVGGTFEETCFHHHAQSTGLVAFTTGSLRLQSSHLLLLALGKHKPITKWWRGSVRWESRTLSAYLSVCAQYTISKEQDFGRLLL